MSDHAPPRLARHFKLFIEDQIAQRKHHRLREECDSVRIVHVFRERTDVAGRGAEGA